MMTQGNGHTGRPDMDEKDSTTAAITGVPHQD
jgi:hypothetical protein